MNNHTSVAIPLVMAFVMLLINADMTIANLAVNQLAQTFHTDIAHLQWVMSAYMLALSSSLILSGCLADKYGSQRILMVGLFGFAISSAVVGFAPNFFILVMSRVVQGLMASLLFLAAVTQLFHSFPSEKKSLAQTYTGVSSALAISFAPLLGGLLLKIGGWQIIFLINVPLALIAALLIRYLFGKNNHPINAKPIAYGKAACVVTGLICLVQGITQLGSEENFSLTHLAFLLLAIVLLFAYVVAELKSNKPLIDIRQLKNRVCLLPSLIRFLLHGIMFFYYFSIVLLAQNVFQLSSFNTSLVFILPGAAIGLSYLTSGKIFDAYDYLIPLRLFYLLSLFGSLILYFVATPSLWLIIVLNSILLFAASSINAGLNTYVLTQSDPKKTGATNGIISTFAFVGSTLTLVIASLIMFNYSNNQIDHWVFEQHWQLAPDALTAIHHMLNGMQDSHSTSFTNEQLAALHGALASALLNGYRHAMLFFAVLSFVALIISLPMEKHKAGNLEDKVAQAEKASSEV